MNFHIITIFPGIFDSYFNESIIKRAKNKNIIDIKIHNLRDWTEDKHKTVDDKPFGGGAGMIMKADVIYKAIKSVVTSLGLSLQKPQKRMQKFKNKKTKIILFSAKGKTWNQAMARKYLKLDNIIMICGRYEGVDERVKKIIDEEISIGDYVLTGGEIPAMAVVDSVSRLLPGVLGNKDSLSYESFNNKITNPTMPTGRQEPKILNYLEFPQYTRPEILEIDGKKYKVPKVLLSGNHKKIDEWREKQSKIKNINL